MTGPSIRRTREDMLTALAHHVRLLESYRELAKTNDDYLGEIAGKLRLLVIDSRTRSLRSTSKAGSDQWANYANAAASDAERKEKHGVDARQNAKQRSLVNDGCLGHLRALQKT